MRAPILALAALLLAFAAPAQADDWPGPQVREVFSASRDRFVRVVPGNSFGDSVGFAGAANGIVEPTGPFEDDPNLTDKKFPGNITASYRSRDPLRVTGEVEDWVSHTPEQLQAMKDGLARLEAEGAATIID